MRVFISHSYEDRAFGGELAGALRAAGLDVWHDGYPPDAGIALSAIEREIRLRPGFVALLSPAALRSERARGECALACALRGSTPGRVVVPVLARAIDPARLWPFLGGVERVEAAENVPLRRVEAAQRALRALVAGAAPTSAAPAAEEHPRRAAADLEDRVLAMSAPRPAGAAYTLRLARDLQRRGKTGEAIRLCEGLAAARDARPDARYLLGWLYQEADRWEEAAAQFGLLLEDGEYALSCYYALGQCARARGDLREAARCFDEAVDRVNLDALPREHCDQLLHLCEEAAEAHRDLGDRRRAEVIYEALLVFLQGKGWREEADTAERTKRHTLAADRR